jgi:hypothetical protein
MMIDALARGIREQHGVTPTFATIEPVELARDGTVYWRGNVYVFDVVGDARATQAFAWTHADRTGHERAIAVLGVPPVTSAQKAAEVALVALYRGKTGS